MSRTQLYYIISTRDFHRPQISRWLDLFQANHEKVYNILYE